MGLGRGDAPGGVGGGSWTPAMALDAAAGVSTGDGIDYGGIYARTDCVVRPQKSCVTQVYRATVPKPRDVLYVGEVTGDRQKF